MIPFGREGGEAGWAKARCGSQPQGRRRQWPGKGNSTRFGGGPRKR